MALRSVDLPMPDSPRMATYSPAASSSEMLLRMERAPKRLLTATSFSTLESYYARQRAQETPGARASRPGAPGVGRSAWHLACEGGLAARIPGSARARVQHRRRHHHARLRGRARVQVVHGWRRHGPAGDDRLAEPRHPARSFDVPGAAVGAGRGLGAVRRIFHRRHAVPLLAAPAVAQASAAPRQ